jgi:hypothetical protein
MFKTKTLINKIILSALSFLVLFFSCASTVTAQDSQGGAWYDQSYDEWYTKVYDEETSPPSEIFGERYTAAQVQWVVYALRAQLDRFVFIDLRKCLLSPDKSSCVSAVENLIEAISSNPPETSAVNNSVLSFVTNPPEVSGVGYVRDTLSNFHLVPEVSAQEGFGFNNVKTVLNLWKAVRNVAYALSTIFVVVLAFMIMFRVKINPQTVITVQSAIPKVVVALILITFSYAIAGLAIDLMYVVIGVCSTVFEMFFPSASFNITSGGWFNIMTSGVLGLGILGNYIAYAILFFVSLTVSLSSITPLSGFLAPIYAILSFIIMIVLILLFLWHSIKVFFLLFKTLANIYISIIFAPLQIGMGIINSNMGFGSWLKDLIANLAVFPLVSALFGMALIFAGISFISGLTHLIGSASLIAALTSFSNTPTMAILLRIAANTNPSDTGGTWPLLISGTNYAQSLIYAGISFVIITMIPKAADIIQGFISGKPFAYGTAVGEALGPVRGVGDLGFKTAAGATAGYYERTGASGLSDLRVAFGEAIRAFTGVKKSR